MRPPTPQYSFGDRSTAATCRISISPTPEDQHAHAARQIVLRRLILVSMTLPSASMTLPSVLLYEPVNANAEQSPASSEATSAIFSSGDRGYTDLIEQVAYRGGHRGGGAYRGGYRGGYRGAAVYRGGAVYRGAAVYGAGGYAGYCDPNYQACGGGYYSAARSIAVVRSIVAAPLIVVAIADTLAPAVPGGAHVAHRGGGRRR